MSFNWFQRINLPLVYLYLTRVASAISASTSSRLAFIYSENHLYNLVVTAIYFRLAIVTYAATNSFSFLLSTRPSNRRPSINSHIRLSKPNTKVVNRRIVPEGPMVHVVAMSLAQIRIRLKLISSLFLFPRRRTLYACIM